MELNRTVTLISGLDFFTPTLPKPALPERLALFACARLCLTSAKLSISAAVWGGMRGAFSAAVTSLRELIVMLLPLPERANERAVRATFRQISATISPMLALTI